MGMDIETIYIVRLPVRMELPSGSEFLERLWNPESRVSGSTNTSMGFNLMKSVCESRRAFVKFESQA
jgi:hypothetical protein